MSEKPTAAAAREYIVRVLTEKKLLFQIKACSEVFYGSQIWKINLSFPSGPERYCVHDELGLRSNEHISSVWSFFGLVWFI